jgi:hypothetical protein
MGRPLFVRRAAALAGDLALLLRGHRCESSPFFTFSCIHFPASVCCRSSANALVPNPSDYQRLCHASFRGLRLSAIKPATYSRRLHGWSCRVAAVCYRRAGKK